MSSEDHLVQTVRTAHGLVGEGTLRKLQADYDTRQLVEAADALLALKSALVGEEGIRDAVLQLHGMAHTVLNGAGMVMGASEETLPDVAADASFRLQACISTLQQIVAVIEPLEGLRPRI